MKLKNNYDIEEIKKEQLKKIKSAIQDVVNNNKEYYKDKDYAKYYLKK